VGQQPAVPQPQVPLKLSNFFTCLAHQLACISNCSSENPKPRPSSVCAPFFPSFSRCSASKYCSGCRRASKLIDGEQADEPGSRANERRRAAKFHRLDHHCLAVQRAAHSLVRQTRSHPLSLTMTNTGTRTQSLCYLVAMAIISPRPDIVDKMAVVNVQYHQLVQQLRPLAKHYVVHPKVCLSVSVFFLGASPHSWLRVWQAPAVSRELCTPMADCMWIW
jgi:hypothetical protein